MNIADSLPYIIYTVLKALLHLCEAIFLAICNGNLGEKDITGSSRILNPMQIVV